MDRDPDLFGSVDTDPNSECESGSKGIKLRKTQESNQQSFAPKDF